MLTFAELARPAAVGGEEEGRPVDSQLWVACAGGMCSVPPVGAAVYYFPQGHAEQASEPVDLLSAARVLPAMVLCRVTAVRHMADAQSDEVFARIRLVPLRHGDSPVDVGEAAEEAARRREAGEGEERQRPASFAKTLTQSDANNGGGFSVPRFCAESIFPALDYSSEPPVQNVFARDVHGVEWKFRHIYRGTPRRHLLTTGWSNFVNQKKLLAGDSIVFVRGDGGEVHVGLRRAKRGFCNAGGGDEGGPSPLPGWEQYRGLMRGNASSSSGGGGAGAGANGWKVPAEDVVAATRRAAAGQPFEVVYYPRSSTPEFCVRASAVLAAIQVQWCPGMRFKMAFETEDSARISWFMGTVAGVQVADPIQWPQSPWRLLQVTWDEPELLQNVKRVCPWLVELVSSMPNFHLPSLSPPRKKPRIPPYTDFPFDGQLFTPPPPPPPPLFHPMPLARSRHHDQLLHSFPFLPFPESSAPPAGIQGARHAQFAPSFSDLHISNLQPSLPYSGARRAAAPPCPPRINTELTISSPPAGEKVAKKPEGTRPPALLLFGQAIFTEEQMNGSDSCGPTSPGAAGSGGSPKWVSEKAPNASEGSGSGVTQGSPTKSNNAPPWKKRRCFGDGNHHHQSPPSSSSEFVLQAGQCKVFVESDAVGRNLDLSALSSFEELYACLSRMFRVDNAELRSHVLYRGPAGEVKHVGDEPFGAFVKSARRLTILTDAGSDNLGD